MVMRADELSSCTLPQRPIVPPPPPPHHTVPSSSSPTNLHDDHSSIQLLLAPPRHASAPPTSGPSAATHASAEDGDRLPSDGETKASPVPPAMLYFDVSTASMKVFFFAGSQERACAGPPNCVPGTPPHQMPMHAATGGRAFSAPVESYRPPLYRQPMSSKLFYHRIHQPLTAPPTSMPQYFHYHRQGGLPFDPHSAPGRSPVASHSLS